MAGTCGMRSGSSGALPARSIATLHLGGLLEIQIEGYLNKKDLELQWRVAGPPHHFDDKVDERWGLRNLRLGVTG